MSSLNLILRRRAIVKQSGGGGILPSGYTQYDWVQADSSTGTPVIDTQYSLSTSYSLATKRWSFEGKFAKCEEIPSNWTSLVIFSNSTGSGYDTCYGLFRNKPNVDKICFNYDDRLGGTNNTVSSIINTGEWHDFLLTYKDSEERGGRLIIDNIETVGKTESANVLTGNLKLLGSGGSTETYYCRLARFKIYDYGVLAADMVPAKRDSDGVVGFYDVVRDLFLAPSTEGVTLLCGYGFENFTV